MPRSFYISFLLLLIFCFQVEGLQGQNYNFTQFENTSGWLNPSLAAMEQEMAVRFNHRMQSIRNWNAIQSSVFTAYYPWLASKKNGPTSSAGLMVHNDKIAPVNGLSFLSIGAPLSFAVSLNKRQRLSFGLMPVYNIHHMNQEGLSTISQYSLERGYNPSLPLNEPLLNTKASYVSWNAGISWNSKNGDEEVVSVGGFSISNLNQPREKFFSYTSDIPVAVQAFFTTSVFSNQILRLMPEVFYSSYGSHVQLQGGASLNYSLRYTNFRKGSLNLSARYNWGKAIVVSTRLDQPAYSVGISADMYTNSELPFTQALEVSLALKQGVVGRLRKFDFWPFERRAKRNRKTGERRRNRTIKEDSLPQLEKKGFLPITGEEGKIPVLRVEVKQSSAKGEIFFGADKSGIQFTTGSYQLRDTSIPSIQSIAEFLLKNPSYQILIVGHTDNVGSPSFNKQLSLKRAESVAQVLLKEGVISDKIFIQGKGMEKPLVPNTSRENRAKNRRVEFLIFKK